MDERAEVLQHQMERTKANLAEKLETLEGQVSDTVQSTTAAVSNTVEAVKDTVASVKESVEGTVQSVAETFDLRLQVERHPWLMLGGAVALGCVAGAWSRGLEETVRHAPPPPPPEPNFGNGKDADQARTESPGASWLWDGLNRFKGLGVGLVMGVVRDLARRELPGPFGEKVAEEVDALTSRLGVEPMHFAESFLAAPAPAPEPREASPPRPSPAPFGRSRF
jgi:hypothetical protein